MKDLTDAEIVEKILKKGNKYFEEIVIRYQNKIFSYLYHFLNGNTEDAKDICSEVFLKAFKYLKTYNSKKPFSPWIYRIAHNEAVSFIRKNKKRIVSIDEEDCFFQIPSEENSKDYAKKDCMKNAVFFILNKIKPKHSEVITLFYIEEKSYEEISEILGENLSTVSTRINRAKIKAKEIIKNDEKMRQIKDFFV